VEVISRLGRVVLGENGPIDWRAMENTSRIRVNSINPGGTRTSMRNAAYPAENPASVPTADTIMPLYLYLMSPDSIGTHAQSLDARDWVAANT